MKLILVAATLLGGCRATDPASLVYSAADSWLYSKAMSMTDAEYVAHMDHWIKWNQIQCQESKAKWHPTSPTECQRVKEIQKNKEQFLKTGERIFY